MKKIKRKQNVWPDIEKDDRKSLISIIIALVIILAILLAMEVR